MPRSLQARITRSAISPRLATRIFLNIQTASDGTPGGATIPFRVTIDGRPPGESHGVDIDASGHGTVERQRMYHLVREHGSIGDRQLEIEFLEPGAEAFVITFG